MVSEHTGCSGGATDDRCGNGLEKIYPSTAVRYGKMGLIGEFSHGRQMKFTCGAKVVIQTHRGIEIGEQVSLTCHGCDKSVTRDQMVAYAKNSGNEFLRLRNGRILREATDDDLTEERHIDDGTVEKRRFCQQLADEAKLPMKVVACEHLFGGERVVYYFRVKGDARVDFRDLVRTLAGEYQTRIEMRQVGARDEARLVADYETCGRECCCKNFLKTLKPVSMKMAKMQKATLDPAKVSGRCGRLKCCLRYEQEGYEAMSAKLPRMGERIRTEHGDGVVTGRQILTQLVQIRTDDNRRVTVVIEDVTERNAKPGPSEDAKRDAAKSPERSSGAEPTRSRRRRSRRDDTERGGGERDGGTSERKDEPQPKSESPPGLTESQDDTGGENKSADDESGTPRRRRRRGRRRGKKPRDGTGPQGETGDTGSKPKPEGGVEGDSTDKPKPPPDAE